VNCFGQLKPDLVRYFLAVLWVFGYFIGIRIIKIGIHNKPKCFFLVA
jgi:hypothetical protein